MVALVSPGVNVSEIDQTTIVPAISTTVGGIAGVFPWGPVGQAVLVSSETDLVYKFGKPQSALNPQTFFTAASFLGYGTSMYVSRAANTTNATAASFNAVASTLSSVNNAVLGAASVTNSDQYLSTAQTSIAAITGAGNTVSYVAKYPGALGNSLRISVCDSTTAWSSNVNLNFSNGTATVNGAVNIAVGSNTLTATIVGTLANTYAGVVVSSFANGDLLTVGNSSIGIQQLQITGISYVNNSSNAVVTFNFATNYQLPVAYVANTTLNGSTANVFIQRSWQYSNLLPQPNTSPYVQQYGNTSAVDTLSLVVVDQNGLFTGVQGQVLEIYSGLSRATDATTVGSQTNYYATVLNQKSSYVWFGNDRHGAASATSAAIASSTNVLPFTTQFIGGTDNQSETNVQFPDLANAYQLYQNTSIPVSLIMQGLPTGGPGGPTYQLANWLVDNLATVRKDVVIFVTPDDSVVTNNPLTIAQSLVTWRNSLRDSSFMVIDSGYKYMYDRYANVYRYVPTNGDVAGLCARTDLTNNPWWSPAGFNRGQLLNVVKLRWNPKQADRDLLYPNGINPIVSFPGQGTVLFGDRTATVKPSAFDRINVRRLFITLEKAIASASRFSLFEFNDAFTRSQFVNMVTPYLRGIQANRGITDFLVVCDTTNNTPEVIDANQFIGDIYIKPNRSINYIQLNFVAVATGVQFSTVVGQF
jgi:hypothetical protein